MADPYLAYVASAYGVSGLALVALAGWVLIDSRAARRRLERLEAERRRPRP